MQHINFDLIFAITLIIPFNGLFLSLIFFKESKRKLSHNLLMGLLLLVLSCISIYQSFSFLSSNSGSCCHRSTELSELLISPFLFLYTASLACTINRSRFNIHLISSLFVLVLLVLTDARQTVIYMMAVIFYCGINGLYLCCAVNNLIDLMKDRQNQTGYFPTSDDFLNLCNGLITFIIMIMGAVCIVHWMDEYAGVIFLPKALFITFIYFRILNKTDEFCH